MKDARNLIKIMDWKSADSQSKARVMKRSQIDMAGARQVARDWIARIADEGDKALVDYIRKFDDAEFNQARLRVEKKDIEEAYSKVKKEVVTAIERQIAISKEFHRRQMPASPIEKSEYVKGVITGWKVTPLDSAGLTVPAGQVPLPTVMQILTVAAKTAGVPRVIACSPPTGPHYEMLIAADIAGLDELYRVGGIAGIAAMAIGTESIAPVLKIAGPGSIYTQAAKLEVAQTGTAIDMLSGPSEALIIADEGTDPRFCAADILARCEHDQNACAVLATTSRTLAQRTAEEIERQLPSLGRANVAIEALSRYSAIVIFDSKEEIIEFANDYSAEHLEILTEDCWEIADQIRNAGSIFLGPFAPVAVGDYASGTNHCLPTGVAPKTVSPVGVDTFMKKSEIQYITREGLANLEPIITELTKVEKLDAHRNSVLVRLED